MWADLKAGKAFGGCLSFFAAPFRLIFGTREEREAPSGPFFAPFRGDTGLMTAIPVPIPATTGLRTGIFLSLPDVSESIFGKKNKVADRREKFVEEKRKKSVTL